MRLNSVREQLKKKKSHGTILDCTSYGPDSGIIAGPSSRMPEMKKTLGDWIVNSFILQRKKTRL